MTIEIQGTSGTGLPAGGSTMTQPVDPESLRRFNMAANGPLPGFDSTHEITPDDLWRTIYSLITRKILEDARVQGERLKDALR